MFLSVELLGLDVADLGVIFEYGVKCVEGSLDDVIKVRSFVVGYETLRVLFAVEALWSLEDGGDVYVNRFFDEDVWEMRLDELLIVLCALGSVSASITEAWSAFGYRLPRDGDGYRVHCRTPQR